MSNERLSPRPIIPIKQNFEASCVVASISMVLSGFGIDVSEQTLVDRYFPTAKLPVTDPNAGVTNTNTVKGMVKILHDENLSNALQIDAFIPSLYEYTRSPEDRYIVKVQTRALNREGRIFKKDSELRKFYNTLRQLVGENEIGVYTANARMLKLNKTVSGLHDIPEEARRGFYAELTDFVRRGHIVGPHGGMTMHTRALDGISMVEIPLQPNKEGFRIIDPRGESYPASVDHLVWVDSLGVSGDVFDYFFRLSPKEEVLNPQQYGFLGLIHRLRRLIP